MEFSILDQSPISSGFNATDALMASTRLVQEAEKLGYKRYWIAEHHDLSGLACSSPETMLGYIGANTTTIRIGAGAVLLPHYQPYKVAEIFHMLATLFPDRIDLGIGRAPGGSNEAMIALSGNFLENVRRTPDKLRELLHFLKQDFPEDHQYSSLAASPIPAVPPEPWMLGTSEKSAILAGETGLSYAYGHFMSEKDGSTIINQYKKQFKHNNPKLIPRVILAASVICAATTEKAEELALSLFLWNVQTAKGESTQGIPSLEQAKRYSFNEEEIKSINKTRSKMIIGSPQLVSNKLMELQAAYQVDEMMIVTITHNYEDRLTSYKLIANELIRKQKRYP